jgi:uncharacterized protein (TIGR02246 family)
MPRDLIEPLLLMATVTLTMSLTSHAGSGPSDAAVRHAIAESHRTYAAAMKRSDVMALASHFAEDAILLPQSSDMQRGRDAIQKWLASWLPTTTFQVFEATTLQVTVVGDTAYEVGTYQMKFTPHGSPPISDIGQYLMVWKHAPDGQWRILRDMYNTNVPPSTPK